MRIEVLYEKLTVRIVIFCWPFRGALSYVLVYKPPSISLFTDYIQSHTQTYTRISYTWRLFVYIRHSSAHIAEKEQQQQQQQTSPETLLRQFLGFYFSPVVFHNVGSVACVFSHFSSCRLY